MRIGLFGGTFNPIHNGHLRAALEVKDGFELDQIFLVPAAMPPHKKKGQLADAADRLAMINLAVEGDAGLMVSEVELNRSGASYTIDTVHYFKKILPGGTEIFLIMGLDAFLEIDTWKSYRELLDEIPLIVIARPNAEYSDTCSGWKTLDSYLKTKISPKYTFKKSKGRYTKPRKNPICIFNKTPLDISATNIRKMIKQGKSIPYLVPPKAAEYIKRKGLYI